MERNKNTLELKTARDGPALTYFSHVLEAVILKAAKDRIKALSRTRTTDVSYVGKRAEARKGRSHSPNAMSLSSKKGRLISFGTSIFAFTVGRIARLQTSED